ncbi:MAG TPA: hypothetical protein VIC63_00595 [Candidatus Limnocylindria bacterium]
MDEAIESETTAIAADPATPSPEPGAEPSDQFLSSLTAAMRRVADDARETSLADARAAIAAKIAAMRATASARSDELKTRAEQDVTGIGEWSRAEIVRIEAETQRKVEQRRAQLAEQLDEHDRRSSAEIAALESQVEDYERELALFFSQLGEITDPDTFISAARRMPRLPAPDAEPAAEPDSPPMAEEAPAGSHEERLRGLGIDRNGHTDMAEGDVPTTNGTEPEAAEMPAATADPEPDPSVAEPASQSVAAAALGDATVDTTTTIAAVGLGSFGAVTSFKTALEKVDGVSAVRLSLGSGGEFMYSVTHRADLDVAVAAAEAQPGATVQRNPDGVVHLSAGKRR